MIIVAHKINIVFSVQKYQYASEASFVYLLLFARALLKFAPGIFDRRVLNFVYLLNERMRFWVIWALKNTRFARIFEVLLR